MPTPSPALPHGIIVLYVGSRSETLLRRWAWVREKGGEMSPMLIGFLRTASIAPTPQLLLTNYQAKEVTCYQATSSDLIM